MSVDSTDELEKYDQLISGGKGSDGDCFRACMATILQLDPSTLPNWHDKKWFFKWDEWLHERGLGISLHSFYYGVEGLWIASVKSQNYSDTTHAVVMDDDVLFHDPSPHKKFTNLEDDAILVSYHIELTNIKLFEKHAKAALQSLIEDARIDELTGLVNESEKSFTTRGCERGRCTTVQDRIAQLSNSKET